MCVIVYKPADKDLTESQIESALNKNPDGYGFMALIDDKIVVKKGGIGKDVNNKRKTADDIKEFIKDYEPFRNLECAIHFRLKSHGSIDEINTHPYKVGSKEVYLMHNGVMQSFTDESDKTKSDTWHFSQYIAKMVDEGWLRDEAFSKIMRKLIGKSRIIFLDEKGFYVPHKDTWIEKNGILYSNKTNISGVDTGYWGDWQNWEPTTRSDVLPRQNHVDYLFCQDGTRVEINRVPKSSTHSYYPSSTTQTSTKITEIKKVEPSQTNFPIVSVNSDRQIDETIERHAAKVPNSREDWLRLSGTQLEDLILEEPETIGEAFFDLLHR